MSRCVPFPPPGYTWNGVSGEALVERLKVRKAEVEKERKREKRRRTKKKKRKKRDLNLEEGEIRSEKWSDSGKHNHCKRKKGEKRSHNKGKRENESSSVTEELEQLESESIYDSSDNSRNIKRKKLNSSPNGCNNHRGIVSMDFQLQKHKDPRVLFRESGSSAARTDLVVQEKFELAPSPIKEKYSSAYGGSKTTAQELAHSELHPSFSQRIEASTDEMAEMVMPSRFSEKVEMVMPSSFSEKAEMLQIEAQYKKLIIDWVPPPIQSELPEFDDQEWLFERRQPRRDITERSDARNDDLRRGSSTLYPCVQPLPEVDMYAMPFTIPF